MPDEEGDGVCTTTPAELSPRHRDELRGLFPPRPPPPLLVHLSVDPASAVHLDDHGGLPGSPYGRFLAMYHGAHNTNAAT